MNPVQRLIQRLVRSVGYDIVPFEGEFPPDFNEDTIRTIRRVKPFTMTSPERIDTLCRSVEYVVNNRIPGDIVECGVWKGGSMMAVALTLLRLGETGRKLHMFDTFEGMPPPGAVDRNLHGQSASQLMASADKTKDWVWAYSTLAEVEGAFRDVGYNGDDLVFVEGKVEDTIPDAAPERIALLRLDTDWYESTRHELEHLYPRLVQGGVLIVDDYGHWEGARRAVDEYIKTHGLRLNLHRVDYTARAAVKLDP